MRSVISSALFLIFSTFTARAEPTTAVLQPSPIKISQTQLPLTIILGDIRGKLEATPLDSAQPKGASAFAQLTFSSDGTSKKEHSAELIVETENGEIVSVVGEGIKTEERDDLRLININGISAKRERRVLIEMRLNGTSNDSLSTLKFAMRARSDETPDEDDAQPDQTVIRQTVALSWPVAECGRTYHAALQKIGLSGGNNLRDVWRDAQRPLKSMSRRWHFRPSVPGRSRRGQEDRGAGTISRNRERAILLETGSLMRSGFRRDLGSRGNYGWEISKTAADLKSYFSQDFNPAICTGAPEFAAYYEEKLAPLGERSVRMRILSSDAALLAQANVVEFVESVRNRPGGHPAWGGAGLKALRKPVSSGDDMKARILRLLKSANAEEEAIALVAKAENAYEALKKLDQIGLKDAGISSRSRRADLRQSLARIEAAIRLAAYRAQYDAFWLSFANSLKDIHAAYREHCVCGS